MKLRVVQEEKADPKVQLEQAITEAKSEHRRITDTAAMVIAHQRQAQEHLETKLEQYDKARASAAQALAPDRARASRGNDATGRHLHVRGRGPRQPGLELESEIREREQALLEATNAADQAKRSVTQNAETIQTKLQEKERLLSVLDQAKMQEAINGAMGQLTTRSATTSPPTRPSSRRSGCVSRSRRRRASSPPRRSASGWTPECSRSRPRNAVPPRKDCSHRCAGGSACRRRWKIRRRPRAE